MSEREIQTAIIAAIGSLPGVLVERTNTGSAVDPRTGRRIQFGMPGAPDLRVTARGRSIAVEVKSATGRQSPEQRRWQAAFEAAGGIYVLARDVATVRDIVQQVLDTYRASL